MGLSEKLTHTSDLMRKLKEQWVIHNPESTDIPIHVFAWRDEDLVASLKCPLDRDTALRAAQAAARGFNATTMALTFESYHSSRGTSPITEEQWRPHEMQYVFETDPLATEKGWVAECLSTVIHERGGGYGMYSQGYIVHDQEVEWLSNEDWSGALRITSDQDDQKADGAMFSVMQAAMSGPTIMSAMKQQLAEGDQLTMAAWQLLDDDEERIFHMDMATLKVLTDAKVIVSASLAAEPGSRRAKMLEERLKDDDDMNVIYGIDL